MACVALEDRTVPATSAPTAVDYGDFYYGDGNQIGLSQRVDRAVVHLDGTASIEQLTATGRFGGAVVEKHVDEDVYILSGPQNAGPMGQGFSWVSPLFESRQTGSWLAATNEVIVALRPGETSASFFAGDTRFSGYRPLDGTPDQFIATVPGLDTTAVVRLSTELQNDPRLQWASPNFYQDFRPQYTPNDPIYPQQWHLNNTGQNGSVPNADVDAPEAWEITQGGSPDIVIAVVDTGMDLTHPDLAANAFINAGEVPGNGVDDDNNGWIDDVKGWDFTSNDNTPTPTGFGNEHATSVGGIAAAVGDNNLGVAGIAYRSKLLPVRIFGNTGSATTSANIAAAVNYAAGRTRSGSGSWRAGDVVNHSWGGGSPDTTITAAFTWGSTNGRNGKGTPTFVSSGNSGTDMVSYPASLSSTLTGVYAVGASTDLDVLAGYSQYGTGLQFVAPSAGGNYGTVTTDLQGSNGYNRASGVSGNYTNTLDSAFGGTSSASPLAAGIGALILSLDNTLTAVQVRGLLRATTDLIDMDGADYDPATGVSALYGYGKVNAFRAVSGVGIAEVQVLEGLTDVPNGEGNYKFVADVGGNKTLTLRVRNQGTVPLTLGAITGLSGPFSSQGFGSSTLAAGASTTFTIRFAPTALGVTVQTLSFTTNDTDEGTFTINLRGQTPTTKVNTSSPAAETKAPVSSVTYTFSRTVSQASFSLADDIVGFTGPAGDLRQYITGFSFTSPTKLKINFAPQTLQGSYALTLGTQIIDDLGQPLDQNENGITAESDDGYSANFIIGAGVPTNDFGYRVSTRPYDDAFNLVPGAPGVTVLQLLSNSDDVADTLSLGTNTFTYYGTTYSSVNISSNGNIHFGTLTSSPINTNLDGNPVEAFIAPFWDDLDTGRNTANDDQVLSAIVGDQLVISWRNVHYYGGPINDNDGITFQVILKLNTGSASGAITFNYLDVDEPGAGDQTGGLSATVGMKNAGDTTELSDSILVAFNGNNQPLVGNNRAVQIGFNTAPTAVANGPYTVELGGTVTLSSTGSSDPDGDPLTSIWDLDGDGTFGETGSLATRGDETGASPTFDADGLSAGAYPVALRVLDALGDFDTATTTVTVQGGAPRVGSVQVNGSTGTQRSSVRSLVVTFDATVSLPANVADAFRLEKLGIGGGDVTLAGTAQVIGGVTVVTLTFSGVYTEGAGSFLTNPSLVDGNYRLTARASQITVGSQQLDGDGNGTGGDDYVLGNAAADGLFRLYGDVNGDRSDNAFDFGQFRGAFGTSNGDPAYRDFLDFNGDGTINAFDFAQFRNRFGVNLPTP